MHLMGLPRGSLLPVLVIAAIVVACGGSGNNSKTPAASPITTAASTLSLATSSLTSSTTGGALNTVDIVRKLRPSVVQVLTEGATVDFFNQPQPTQGIGTGVILDTDGHIITNNHVVRLGGTTLASSITVTLSDGTTVPASVVGTDPQTDLAVIKVSQGTLAPAELGDSSSLPVGSEVVAMGYALGLEGDPTVTQGVVSAVNRTIQEQDISINDAIQTDASINPGNSGGPLVDDHGRVVGINTAIVQGAQNVGFAISINTAKPIVQELIQNGKVTRGYLGVNFQDIPPGEARNLGLPSANGVYITQVTNGSPADNAGLQRGDVIVSLAGQAIRNSGDLVEALRNHPGGDNVAVDYYRDGTKESSQITLGERPAGQ
jgi:serine protease Do